MFRVVRWPTTNKLLARTEKSNTTSNMESSAKGPAVAFASEKSMNSHFFLCVTILDVGTARTLQQAGNDILRYLIDFTFIKT
jgi:hypothetical protein